MNSENIFNKLWQNYITENPSALKIYNLLTNEGEVVENDHIAFRTFDHPSINVDVLSKAFLEIGYVSKGEYHFEEKKLFAKHFEHASDQNAPRVFISQLKTEQFSEFLQNTVNEIVKEIDTKELQNPELLLKGRLWKTPSYDTYEKLRQESEYAAWLYVNGFKANHFTVSLNHLKNFKDIYQFNQFLKSHGFEFNSPNNEVQGTEAELLQQSSTVADVIEKEFVEGKYKVTACYYEFAMRFVDKDGKLFSGFQAKSADKIFESTNYRG